jgi:hypothetical protein
MHSNGPLLPSWMLGRLSVPAQLAFMHAVPFLLSVATRTLHSLNTVNPFATLSAHLL